MSKWKCAVCSKQLKTKKDLVEHLKEEIDQYDFERQMAETAEDQLYDLTGEID